MAELFPECHARPAKTARNDASFLCDDDPIKNVLDGKLDTRASNGESDHHGAREAGQSRVLVTFCYF